MDESEIPDSYTGKGNSTPTKSRRDLKGPVNNGTGLGWNATAPPGVLAKQQIDRPVRPVVNGTSNATALPDSVQYKDKRGLNITVPYWNTTRKAVEDDVKSLDDLGTIIDENESEDLADDLDKRSTQNPPHSIVNGTGSGWNTTERRPINGTGPGWNATALPRSVTKRDANINVKGHGRPRVPRSVGPLFNGTGLGWNATNAGIGWNGTTTETGSGWQPTATVSRPRTPTGVV